MTQANSIYNQENTNNSEEHKCEYCGQTAHYQFKNGKWCCCKSANQCPEMKNRNSKGILKKYDELEKQGKKRHFYDYNSLPEETKEKMKVIKKGDTKEINEILKKCSEHNNYIFTEEHKRKISKSLINHYNKLGYYDNLSERELYYKQCEFKFSEILYDKIIGYELLKQYGWYESIKNKNGVTKDHKISKLYGFMNNIDPKMICHPANCKFMLSKDNSSKREKCSITVEELKEAIKEWDMKYGVYNQEIYDEHLLD